MEKIYTINAKTVIFKNAYVGVLFTIYMRIIMKLQINISISIVVINPIATEEEITIAGLIFLNNERSLPLSLKKVS